MSRHLPSMTDEMLDRRIRSALRLEADRIAAVQRPASVAMGELASRLEGAGSRGGVFARPFGAAGRRTVLVWVVLLLAMALALIVVGAQLLWQTPTNRFANTPFGPPRACAQPHADGMTLQAFREEAVLMVDRSGLVTTQPGAGGGPPADEGSMRTLIEARFVAGVLEPAGVDAVHGRLSDLGIEPGCHRVRTQRGDAAIYANTPEGPRGIQFSAAGSPFVIAPRLSASDESELRELLDDLFDLKAWLGPGQFTSLDPSELDSWIVHTTFRPTGLDRSAVLELGAGITASARDGRYDAVRLPSGGSLREFGTPIPGATDEGEILVAGYLGFRARDQRCAVLSRADALRLADSLDKVILSVEGSPDLYSPDMATAITVRLHPAIGAHATCEGFAESINGYPILAASAPEPSEAPISGDLGHVDPCSFVPGDLRGPVDLDSLWQPSSPFGVSARSCILKWRQSMTAGGERAVWLYPRSVSESEARSLSTWIFGPATEQSANGRTVWLNDCMVAEDVRCRWAVAGLSGGQYLLLELDDRSATREQALADFARILIAAEGG